MALGSSAGTGSSGPLLFLTPRTKDPNGQKVAPHFTIDRKNEKGEFARDPVTVNKVSGDLFKVEVRKGEYEGEPTYEGVFYLRDAEANESYRLGVRFGIAGRGLFNSLYSLLEAGDFTALTIDYYLNKGGFDAYGLKQGEERDNIKWAIQLDEQPKPEAIMHKGKLVKNDYSALNEYWCAKLEEIGAKVNKAPATQKQSAAKSDTAAETPAATPTKPATPAKTTPAAKTATKSTKAKTESVGDTAKAAVATGNVDPF